MNAIKNVLKNLLNLFKKKEDEIPDDFVIVDKFKNDCEECDCVKYIRERIESDDSSLPDEKFIRSKNFKQKQRKRRNAYGPKKYN